jgi:hypothetical protein
MALDFDVTPWYDDFDPKKNYHRILFKPGYAVQARELTQSQTILQDQISKFGQGVYTDGSVVTGAGITIDSNIVTCKLTAASKDNISGLTGLYAVGSNSGFITLITAVDTVNYYITGKGINTNNNSSFASGETINLYTSKIDALNSLNNTITPQQTVVAETITSLSRTVTGTYLSNEVTISTIGISVGDMIKVPSVNTNLIVTSIIDGTTLTVNKSLVQDLTNASATVYNQISVHALEVNIADGVWFTNGVFVNNYASTIIPDPVNAYPSVVIGFEVDEQVVYSYSDPSLLDPAIGASNYQAPGADRYNIELNLVTKPYVSDQTVSFGSLTNSKFIELVRINKGVIEDIISSPILNDISGAIAQSVSDTAGDFIVNPFSLLIGNATGSANTVMGTISPGKAYIGGYPIQHIASTPYYLNKARDTIQLNYQDITTYYGDYTKVQNLNGSIPNFQTGTVLELHNVHFGAANSYTKIGTARVRNFAYDSGSGAGNIANGANTLYKIFLTDVKLINNAFSNVQSVIIPGSGSSYSSVSFSANTVTQSNLIDNTYNSLLFPFPQVNVSNVSNIDYVTTRLFNVPTFSSGVATITTNGAFETFVGGGVGGVVSSSGRQINYIVMTTSASGNYANGEFIPMDQSNVSITITNSPGTPQASINIGGNFNGSAIVYATISVSNDNIKTKTLVSNYSAQVSANNYATAIDLGVSDVYQFNGIYEMANNYVYEGAYSNTTTYTANNAVLDPNGNVYIALTTTVGNYPNTSLSLWSALTNNTTNYITDNGQRDTYYAHGTIKNTTGVARGNVVVVMDYFTHSGGTGFFDVNSYPVTYGNIPEFTSPQYGTTLNLTDVLDFRPRQMDGIGNTGLNNYQLPAPFNNVYANYGYYLSRIDKIVMYPNGQFKTITGIPAYTNPVAPADVPGTMTIFTIYFPAYTFDKNSIQVTPSNIRRYSMKDIGILDKRISQLEYYTSLSILENQVAGQDVTDSTGLNLLFKNGYLVDSFNGSSVADVKNPDYAASIDPVNQLARPLFFSNVATYSVDTTQGTFVTSPGNKTNNQLSIKDNIVTFSYNDYPLVVQDVATELINVNPFNVVNFIGSVSLSPASDVWYSTQTKPNVNIVTDDQAAWIAAVNGTGNGSQWNDWQLNWTGQSTDTVVTSSDQTSITRDTTAITNVIKSQGLTSAINGGPIQVSSTSQVLSNAVIPFARSIPINFEINGMEPFLELHTFMSGVCVDSYVTPGIGYTDTINYINIVSGGSGYTNGVNLPIIEITGANTTPAIATANVSGGSIVAINITSIGAGYTSIPTISVTDTSGSGASLTANGASYMGGRLVTDINGTTNGTIQIPDDSLITLPTGTILVEFSDNFVSPVIGKSYARTTFLSQGTLQTSQTSVISTRPPLVTPVPAPVPTPSTPSSGTGSTPAVTPGIVTPKPVTPTPTPTPAPAPTPPVVYYGNDSLSPSTVAEGSPLATTFSNAYESSLLGGPLSTPTQSIVQSILGSVDDEIEFVQGQPPTATEALASLQWITNQYQSDPTQTPSQLLSAYSDVLVKNVTNANGEGVAQNLQDVAASYVNDPSNSTAYTDAFAAGSTAATGLSGACPTGTDPLSQNFFVDGTKYPNGLFLSSVDLYFATKDETIPVSVRVKPTVNGYPDAVNDIPGSIVWKNPSDINVPSTSNLTGSIGPTTTFTFDHPIYLQPGQYSIMIAANSNQYNMYGSKLGQVQYGTTSTVVNTVTYSGSLFKSQNASTWVPAPSETLCFNLNICDFAGGGVTYGITSGKSNQAIKYDLLQLVSSDLSFNGLDSINYAVKSTDASTGLNTLTTLTVGSNQQFQSRQSQNNAGDIVVQSSLTNIDRWTSPVNDMQRLNTILVQNILTPYYSANTVQESLGGFGNGGAAARYITRRVTLDNNMVSTGITVFLDVNRQPGTKIEVYYKVLNQNDPNNFDLNPYVLMNPILAPGSGLSYTDSTSFTSDTYQALNIQYNDITTGTLYNNFNVFAIKVCFYSSNPSIAPQIKNFRAIATA